MNCDSIQKLIALYSEGDLGAAQATTVEAHLLSCAACQSFLNELEASQAMVKALAAETLDPASFDRVRQRVMEEVSRAQMARTPWWRLPHSVLAGWSPAWAVGLALVLGLGFLLPWRFLREPAALEPRENAVSSGSPTHQEVASSPTPVSSAEAVQKPELRQLALRRKVLPRHRLALAAQGEPESIAAESEQPVEQCAVLGVETTPPADIVTEPLPPLLIKLMTDDPNIVIVWLVDLETQEK